MRFTKMHGAGNDYIYVNCFQEQVDDPEDLARRISDRHFGIGSDGLVLIEPSDTADFRMDIYNADGSRAKMCGNATRCVAKYVYDHQMTRRGEITLETLSGIKHIKIIIEGGQVTAASVNMGAPEFDPEKIPVLAAGGSAVGIPVQAGDAVYTATCVSMGNPHCVVFVDDTEAVDIEKTGPLFEKNALFPDRVNTEFIQIVDGRTLKMRVWERGAGETLACGTGACAAAAAAVVNGYCRKDEDIGVLLRGGTLTIRWLGDTGEIMMTGPAQSICSGEYPAV